MLDPENKSDGRMDVEVTDDTGSPDSRPDKKGLGRFSGIWKDHPDIEAFRDNIDAYRRSVDESPQ